MTNQQVIIGMDPHKSSNTIVVMTPDETMLTRRRFVNSDDGFIEMLDAVRDYPDRVWAVEGANGVGRSVAQRLVAFGETVVDVPAKLATRVRVYSTGHGTKTDNADAVAIARAAIHSKHLRRVMPDDATVAMKLLSDRRHELVGLRTQAMCRLHRLLRELIAGGAPRQLSAEKAFDLLNDLKPDDPANVMRLETGRSQPSREMLLCLAAAMDVPMRGQNEMLAAGGYPPAFHDSSSADDAIDPGARAALDLMLERHEPFPVFVMDARFDIVRMNRAARRFFDLICTNPTAIGDTPNGYHMFLHPDLGRDALPDWPDVAALLVGLLHRKVLQSPDNHDLRELLDEVLALPDVAQCGRTPDLGTPATSVFTFRFQSAGFTGDFLSTLTTFIAPNNIALEELSIESYYPLDEPTARACHQTLDQQDTKPSPGRFFYVCQAAI